MPKERVACALCGSQGTAPLTKRDRDGFGIRSVLCNRCGHIFTNPRPTHEAMAGFHVKEYRRFYFGLSSPGENYENTELRKTALGRGRWQFDLVRALLRGVFPDAFQVLDMGCGDGAFLQTVLEKVPSSRRLGVEPCRSFGEFAAGQADAEVFIQTLEKFLDGVPPKAGDNDLIVLSHVLEHVAAPVDILKHCRALLKEGGRLYVEVPNILSPFWRGVGMFHIAHLHHFYPRTLLLALARAGFRCEQFVVQTNPVDPWALSAFFSADDTDSAERFMPSHPEELGMLIEFIQARALGWRRNVPLIGKAYAG